MDVLTCTPELFFENESLYKNQVKNADVWQNIPLVNCNELHELKDNHLVRFRGMVQDMYNPEYYFEKFEVQNDKSNQKYVKNGKYRDATDLLEHETILFESDKNVTNSRQTFVLISLPGTNSWVQNVEKETNKNQKQDVKKLLTNNSGKRSLNEDDEMQIDNSSTSVMENGNKIENKKHCINKEASTSTNVVSREHILNFPLSEENGKCCHLKVYEDQDSLKLNEMVDVIGFLSLDPLLTDPCNHDNDDENQMEVQTHNPPPSLVPRIHCVFFRKVEDCNPLTQTLPVSPDQIVNLRKDLSLILTQLLLGDELTADYLMCHLISTVYLRKDLLALGKFAVNVSNIPAIRHPNYGEELYDILQLLLPKSHYLPMTLDNMNSLNFIPKKDYECNRLTSGVLQLSFNTHLVLDETRLQPGKLNDSGCRGLAALSNTIKNQKVTYDFNYYQMEYDCDIPFLVLSEGKSMLPSDFHVPLVPDGNCLETFPEITKAAKHFLKPDLLNNLRVFLSKVRHSTYELPNNTMELIQNEFVKMRQNGKVTGDDLHQLLVLARLICLSLGKSTLDEECWYKACDMESKRKERIAQYKK